MRNSDAAETLDAISEKAHDAWGSEKNWLNFAQEHEKLLSTANELFSNSRRQTEGDADLMMKQHDQVINFYACWHEVLLRQGPDGTTAVDAQAEMQSALQEKISAVLSTAKDDFILGMIAHIDKLPQDNQDKLHTKIIEIQTALKARNTENPRQASVSSQPSSLWARTSTVETTPELPNIGMKK